jgi:hypothetical protein
VESRTNPGLASTQDSPYAAKRRHVNRVTDNVRLPKAGRGGQPKIPSSYRCPVTGGSIAPPRPKWSTAARRFNKGGRTPEGETSPSRSRDRIALSNPVESTRFLDQLVAKRGYRAKPPQGPTDRVIRARCAVPSHLASPSYILYDLKLKIVSRICAQPRKRPPTRHFFV